MEVWVPREEGERVLERWYLMHMQMPNAVAMVTENKNRATSTMIMVVREFCEAVKKN